MKSHTAFLLALRTAIAHAGSRGSTDYSIPTDSIDTGGQRTTNSAYTNDGSLGGITGISTVAISAMAWAMTGRYNTLAWTTRLPRRCSIPMATARTTCSSSPPG